MHSQSVEPDVVTLIWLLILAFGGLMLVRRTKLPYTVALVIIGLIVGATHSLKAFELSHDLVFAVFLPPLLFEAAIRLPVHHLKRNWQPIAILVGPGVVLSTFIIGYAIHYWVGLSLLPSLLFGALISATDPISVLARFKSLKVDKRLSILVEGESLFNDGTATVLFASLLAAVLAGTAVDPRDAASDFLRSIAGGVIIGGAIGWGISLIMARINDHLAEITLTTIAAYGASLLADSIGTSGVISVISSGIVLGYYRSEAVMSATTRAAVYSFWEYIAFVVNSILFLLIGIDVTIPQLARNIVPVLIAIGVVSAARIVVIYLSGAFLSRSTSRIPFSWLQVLNFAGLRGAMAIALAFSLPRALEGSSTIFAMTYGVVLWTLLVQGLSIGWVLEKLGVAGKATVSEGYERIITTLEAKRASALELEEMKKEGFVSLPVYNELSSQISDEREEAERQFELHQAEHGQMLDEQKRMAKQRLLAAQQNAVRQAVEAGMASEDTARQVLEQAYEGYGEERERE